MSETAATVEVHTPEADAARHLDIDPDDYGPIVEMVHAAHAALRDQPPFGVSSEDVDRYFAARATHAAQEIANRLEADRRAYFAVEVRRAAYMLPEVRDRLTDADRAVGERLVAADPAAIPRAVLRKACRQASGFTDRLYALGSAAPTTAAPRPTAQPSKILPKPAAPTVFFSPTPWNEAVAIGQLTLAARQLMAGEPSPGRTHAIRAALTELVPMLSAYEGLWGNPHAQPPERPEGATTNDDARVDAFLGAFTSAGVDPAFAMALKASCEYPTVWADPVDVACWIASARTVTLEGFLAEWDRQAAPGALDRIEAIHRLLDDGTFAVGAEGHLVRASDYYGGDVAAKLAAVEEYLGANGGAVDPEEAPPPRPGQEGADDSGLDHERWVLRAALTRQRDRLNEHLVEPSWPELRPMILLSDPAISDDVADRWLRDLQADRFPASSWRGFDVYKRYGSPFGPFGSSVEQYIARSWDPFSEKVKVEDKALAEEVEVSLRSDGIWRTVAISTSQGSAKIPVRLFLAGRAQDREGFLRLGVVDEVGVALQLMAERSGEVYAPAQTLNAIESRHTFIPAPGFHRVPGVVHRGGKGSGNIRGLKHRFTVRYDVTSWHARQHVPASHYPNYCTPFIAQVASTRRGVRQPPVPTAYFNIETFWWLEQIPADPNDIDPDLITIRVGVPTYPNPFYHEVAGPTARALLLDPTLSAWMRQREAEQIVSEVYNHFRKWVDDRPDVQSEIAHAVHRRRLSAVPWSPCTTPARLIRRGTTAQVPDPHQNEAVALAGRAGGGLLAFDVGVGKTLSAILTLLNERQAGRARRPVIVVPKQLVPQWIASLATNAPGLRVGICGVEPQVADPAVEARRLAKQKNPISGLPYSPEEIAVIVENASLPAEGREARVAKWRAFRDGAYDVLLVTLPAWRKTAVAPAAVDAFVKADRPLQRWITLASLGQAKRRRVFLAQGGGQPFGTWRDEIERVMVRDLTLGPPRVNERVVKALAGTYLNGVVPEIVTDFGLALNAEGEPINPRTGTKFHNRKEIEQFAGTPAPLDPVWIGADDSDLPPSGGEIVAVPVDFLVADEAHAYKATYSAEKRGYVAGGAVAFLSGGDQPSIQAFQMLTRTAAVRALRRRRGLDGGVLLLTATPAKASPLELFNLFQLCGKDELVRLGVDDPERFISMFISLRTFPLAGHDGTIERRTVARDVERDAAGLDRLMRSVALVRGPTDVPRLAGNVAVAGEHGECSEGGTLLRDSDADFTPVKAAIGTAGTFLKVLRGANVGDYAIRAVAPGGDEIEVYPPFASAASRGAVQEGRDTSFQWQIRTGARVPITPPLTRIETDLSGTQQAIYDAAFDAHGRAAVSGQGVGHAIVPNLLNLALHPAMATFGAKGEGTYTQVVNVLGIDPRFLGVIEEEKDETADDEEVEVEEDSGLDESKATASEVREGKKFVAMVEKCLRPGEAKVAGAKQALGLIDPAESPKLLKLAEMLVDSMANDDLARDEIPCGHIVFIESVEIHAMLLVLLRRMIESRRGERVEKLRAEGRSPEEIAIRTARLNPRRVAVMNAPIHDSDPNRYQIVADGFNGRYEVDGDSVEVVRFPAYDVLIANKVAAEGWDLQSRTCYMHMLDLPWDAATFIQRLGRAVRQGNLAGKVEVFVHLSRGTLDYFRLTRVEGRRGWLAGLLRGAAATAKLADGDPEAQIQGVLAMIPQKYQAAREAQLRKQFADVAEANAKAAQAEMLQAVQDLADSVRLAASNGSGAAYTARGRDALGTIARLRQREDAPPFPWLGPAVAAILRGDPVLLPTPAEAAKGLPAVYPGAVYEIGGWRRIAVYDVRWDGVTAREVRYASDGTLTAVKAATVEAVNAEIRFVPDVDFATVLGEAPPPPTYRPEALRIVPDAWAEAWRPAMEKAVDTGDTGYLGIYPFDAGDAGVVFAATYAGVVGRIADATAQQWIRWVLDTTGTVAHPLRDEYADKLRKERADRRSRWEDAAGRWATRDAAHEVYVAAAEAWKASLPPKPKPLDPESADEAVAAHAAAQAAYDAAVATKPATVPAPGPKPIEPAFMDPVWPSDPPKPKLILPTLGGWRRFRELVDTSWPPVGSASFQSAASLWFNYRHVSPSLFFTLPVYKRADTIRRGGGAVPNRPFGPRFGVDIEAWNSALRAASTPTASVGPADEEAEP